MNLRLLALAGVAAVTVALPLAVASAGPVGDGGPAVVRASEHDDRHDELGGGHGNEHRDGRDDGKGTVPEPGRSPLLLGLGLATAARCGPELSSPDGIEAQTCVLTQGEDTWARTYYRNATGDELSSALSLMEPDGRTVQMYCAVGAGDEPGMCETPRRRTAGEVAAYTAVAEFAEGAGRGPLLLRSGSNSRRS
ncbi:hypothetical protein [Streptomyces sp. NPDC058371]|uniref:hypothetical protein n=1 Tax=Streptomyces sp. NPDC058371 TaxID=3346463 RepID=UPI00365FFA86